MEVFDISQHSSPHDAAEPDLGENLDQPPSGAEATVELEDEEPAPVVEQPRKRKSKTKNICVTPGKPLISRRSDLLNAPSPPCAPALPALPLPLPLDLPVCSAQPVLPTNLVPSQRHPRDAIFLGTQPNRQFLWCSGSGCGGASWVHFSASCLTGPIFRVQTITFSAVRVSKRRVPSKKKPGAGKTEKCKTGRGTCKIPGCFLRDLENAKQYSGRNFKQNKDSLVQKIYTLFNSSVFDKKLPEKIDIGWNKKMLRTAGLCTTGETRYPKKQRYAKIEISLKVCDSADRLRDTLIHEICHAASWLLDGVRDSHGDAWKYYAKKSNMVHPELPMVTRCHNYQINYRIHYECTRCKTRVGRYTRSLNTDLFICAKCKGPLVMLPLTRKDGTPIAPHVRPFAKYVQENYRTVKHETEGISHGDVMRRLSKDYADKQRQGR
ncbi:germ cell nuclear acidic protein [Ursus arctos]|uniref:germ cell nuclear acidic protein n=1 Tax=Ursus arctos TaxID=9644 RepID=UPI0025472A78|nr:germ cell nuclear acidic protein [Ursus arctos]